MICCLNQIKEKECFIVSYNEAFTLRTKDAGKKKPIQYRLYEIKETLTLLKLPLEVFKVLQYYKYIFSVY